MTPLDGVLVVDKPVGPTSHDVVAVARRALGTSRVGHTGTLDPLASGIVVLVVGRATRLARYMAHDRKTYEAQITFGRATTTYDAEGDVTSATGRVPDRDALEAELDRRLGVHDQMPPAFSAKKVGGQVAHRAARAASPLALAPVSVTLHALALESYAGGIATLTLEVSSGFYVRSLAHDLGLALGTGAHLSSLRRVHAGPHGLDDAVPLETLATDASATRRAVLSLDRLLPAFPAAHLDHRAATRVRHGGPVPAPSGLTALDVPVRLVDPDGHLVGVGEIGDRGVLQPVVVLG